MLRRNAAFNMAKYPEIFFPRVCDRLLDRNESYVSYVTNIFKGSYWAEISTVTSIAQMWNVSILILSSALANQIDVDHNLNNPMIIIIANGDDIHTPMPVTHFSSSQSKELRSTLPGTGLNITKLEPKKYKDVEDGKNMAKRWANSANKRVILQRLQGVDTCIDNFEQKLIKMNEELKHLKIIREHLAQDVVSLGLAVDGVTMTEKANLPSKSVQTGQEEYETHDEEIRQLEEATAVKTILKDHTYDEAMKLMPPELKELNFSCEVNMQICDKIKQNPTKNIIVSVTNDDQITLEATDKQFDLLPNDEVTTQLNTLEQAHTQVTADVFNIPQQNYPLQNIVPHFPSFKPQLDLPHTISSADQLQQLQFQPTQQQTQQLDPVYQDEFPKTPSTDSENKEENTTTTFEGKIPCDGCNKTFTRKNDLEKHKL